MSLSDRFLSKPDAEPGEGDSEARNEYTLLLVDDEPKVVESLKRVFGRRSYRVLTASSGPAALRILEDETVHLVISDHRMPRMTGAELLTTIRSKWPEIIRIMLTGYADIQSIMSAVKEGSVFKFITKPWQDDDLRLTVARALEQYQLQQDVQFLLRKSQQSEVTDRFTSNHFNQDRGNLAKILVRAKKISPEQHEGLQREQERTSTLMYRLVQEQTGLGEDVIASAIERSLSVHPIDLKECRVAARAAALVPPECCLENLLLPIKLREEELTVAMADPSDIFKRDAIESLTGYRVNTVLARGRELEQRIREVYGFQSEDGEDDVFDPIDEVDVVIESEEAGVDEMLESTEIPPVVRIVNALLSEAMNRGASDLHITPRVNYTTVRYRIDGLLQERVRLPLDMHPAVTSRIKILASMDIAERRRPQDGRMTVRMSDRIVDLRISSLPALYGENLVLRVLDRGTSIHRLEDLGLEKNNLKRIRVIARRPQGIFICTGPTGSGKTTLLYSLLRENLQSEKSYGTLEDPVEYYIEEATQVHVKEKTGVTFPSALRAMLRQDPDVLLIGEMRDHETADIAFQAALTGHLVLSTLHTVSAVESITRLVDMGVERYLLATALNCVIAQRLVRTLCMNCRRPVDPDPLNLELLRLPEDAVPEYYRGEGCDACGGLGYAGRVGIFEVLEITEEVSELILSGASQSRISEIAGGNGMLSLFDDALSKLQHGVTTLDEVVRVLGPRPTYLKSCPDCHCGVKPNWNVCPSCGHTFVSHCQACGDRTEDGWSFCARCGAQQMTNELVARSVTD